MPPTIPATHSTSDRHDDTTLRAVFDDAAAWKAFSASGKNHAAAGRKNKVGLFGNAYLTEPAGFMRFTHASLNSAQRIVAKVARAATLDEYCAVVRDLDRLSDLLCRVIDLCDFVRTTTPDAAIQHAASDAWATTYQYMNQLNTTSVLNDQLGHAMATPAIWGSWSEEERTVAEMLKLDFTKSAVNLPQASRDRFVELSQRIGEVGTQFVDSMAPAQPWVDLPSTACHGLDPTVAKHFGVQKAGRRVVRLPSVSGQASLGLRTIRDEDARKSIYYATRTASPKTVRLLENMVGLRAELAQLSGFESYAHMALRDRMMAKSPESVRQFLQALAANNGTTVRGEVQELLARKQQATGDAHASLAAWDKDYYMSLVRREALSAAPPRKAHNLPLSEYFSLGTVMQGLSRLFQRLYGLRLVPHATPPGETWHPDVRRLDVVSDTQGHVAVLYCDLFYREDKSPNPAHFTVRCSREIAQHEVDEHAQTLAADSDPLFTDPLAAANDGMALSTFGGVVKQLPTIALVCDFTKDSGGFFSSGKEKPALLTHHEVETLFHEMGHAVHSVLARTSLQTVSGTRCATDLAELPSTLMEHFASDPSVLALFARHYETGAPVDYEQVSEGLRRARRFEGIDDETQIVLAMLDQVYHGTGVGDKFDSTLAFHNLQRRVTTEGSPVDPPGTCWQGFFGHLFGYGSTYYSYLFDRVLAERVWGEVFNRGSVTDNNGGALDRANGEHLRDSLLRWGGGRDAWRCVSDTLRDPRVAAGDEAAMALVGSWGIHQKGQ